MRIALLLLCLLYAIGRPAAAQDTDTTDAWQTDLISKLAASQAGYRNWAEGGVSTLALTLSTDGKAERKEGNWTEIHETRLAFGLVQQDTLNVRKAEDLIRLASAFQYAGDGFFRTFNPTLAASARSQFAPGYNYDKNPFEGDERTPPVKVSDILSPGVFTQSFGLTFDPEPWIKQRLGIGAKETVVLIDRFRPLYSVDSTQAVRFEMGLESRTAFDREVWDNVRLQSTLGLFAAFNMVDTPDALWENLVVMQVNKHLSVNFEFVTLYDRDVSRAAQLKEVLSLGVTVAFL